MENSTLNERAFPRLTKLTVVICFMALPASVMLFTMYQDYIVFALFNSPAKGSSNDSLRESNDTRPIQMLPDELIDTTKFDPQSCLSRAEYQKYRKPSPHNPSPYLLSKVRKYEHLYRQCGPNTESYKAAMKELQAESTNHGNYSSPCKYVIWRPANGLGNRMLSLVSAFLYGLLTDRVLLADHDKNAMSRLFCEPFPNSTWLLPEEFRQVVHGYDNDKNNANIQTFKNFVQNSTRSLMVHVDLRYGYGTANIEIFLCDHSQELLHGIPAIILLSDQYFVPSLFTMPFFQEELSKLFPEKEAIFNLLGNYLFQPSNEAWEMILTFYQAYLEQVDTRVGLQIRVFHPQNSSSETIVKQILSCTWTHNLLPKIRTNITNATGQEYLNNKNQSVLSTAILAVSLHSIYGDSLKEMYGNDSNDMGQVIRVHQPSHEDHQKYGNQEHDIQAWVEIYLLSLSDVLVTSYGSTFGYVAQSLGGLKPWILDNVEDQSISNPSCRQALSTEPCFHYPPKLGCGTNTTHFNITALFPYIRPCEDCNWGVKLVSNIY